MALIVSCLVALSVVHVQAWYDQGHTVVAEIARTNLNPGVEVRVSFVVSTLIGAPRCLFVMYTCRLSSIRI